ncbi:MAG TPA: GlsB/YeaQ/YmgE family stress response membrane protein [Actinomycetota bacterium]|nr:GlsB/YeaQ/YmgE family stress response membrane protein [Actinomycetota bacterium]
MGMNIIWWLLVGLIAGALARLLLPGRDPMGFVGTLVLGLVGSLVGGFIGSLFTSGDDDFSPAGIIGSVIGAVIALLIWRAMSSRRPAA